MEEIYVNVEYDKSVDPRPSTSQTGPTSSRRRFHGAVVLCLGLLSVFLLAGLIGLGVHTAELSILRENLTAHLLASDHKLSSLTEERDLLNVSLKQMTQELTEMKTCPEGWMLFRCTCYLLSNESGSWEEGREDCRDRGADLVVIGSTGEQVFLSDVNKGHAWIGLTDKDKEGTWTWIDGAPMSLQYWKETQPDNGGGHQNLGQEDCAHIGGGNLKNWNDLSCKTSLRWICEKKA